MNRVVAFDLDGTLSQSESFLMPAYRRAISEMGQTPAPDEELKNMIGGSLEDNWQIAMPGRPMEDFLACVKLIHRYAVENADLMGRPYPQIPESLARLKQEGYLLALCSNGTDDYVGHILDALKIRRHFDLVQANIPGQNKSGLLAQILRYFSPAQAVMVGDRHFDETAARDNGIPFIGCAYGIYPGEVQAADVVIQSAAELPEAVARAFALGAGRG